MRKGKLNRRQFMLYSGATLLFPTFPACGGGEPTSTSVNIPNVREAVDNENLGALAGFIDFDKLIPPGFKDAVSNFEKEIVAGIGAGIDPSAFVNAENPLEAVVPVLELIATSAASAIPGVGFVVSGVLSVIFQWVNDSMKNKADMNAIIHKIVNQAIEDNNFRMMQLSVEGMHNQLTDYIGLLQARMPLLIAGAGGQISPLDPTVAETIKEKADGINTYIEGEIPKFLIKGSEIHGVPLYAHVAALGGNLYVDFLRQRDLLGNALSQQDFLRIYNEVETQLFRHQQRLAEVVRDYGKSKGFIEYNRFINGLYQFSSYGFLLNVIKKRHEALYRKRIRIRTSMELYECGVSDDIDYMAAVVRTNLPERVSMMTSLHGYSHRGDYPLIQRLNQAFVSADGKPLTDYQQSCVGAVGDGPDYETFIDVNFPTAEFGGMPVGNGFSIPSKVAVWQFGSTGAAPGTPRAITIADQGDTQRFLGQKLPLDGGGLFDHFSAVGYYLSGFLTAQGGGSGFGGSCVADSGNSIGFQGAIFRHWSSLGQIPRIDADHGVELDLTCGYLTGRNAPHISLDQCYRDVLIGKSVLFVKGGAENAGIGFSIVNATSTTLHCDVILTVASAAFDPIPDSADTSKNITVRNKATGQKIVAVYAGQIGNKDQKCLYGQNNLKFMEFTAARLQITSSKSGDLVAFSMPDSAGFYFAYAIVIPIT